MSGRTLARRDARGRWTNPDPDAGGPMPAHAFARWAVTERAASRVRNAWRGEALPRVTPHAARALAAADEGLHVTWTGHASLVVRVNGRTLLTDPVWSRTIGPAGVGMRRLTPPGVPWEGLPRVDAVLVSHNHYDHLDVRTLRRLPRDTPVLCPVGVRALFTRLGFTDVTELAWWEHASRANGARFTCVPAQHFSRRGALDADRSLWGGWVVEADGYAAYFAGDSGWMRTQFDEIGRAFDLDAAFLPVGAYLPRAWMAPVHMSPWDAGRAFLATRARTLVPVHWGTFRLADEPMDAPPRDLERWRRDAGVDAARVRVPALGETVDLAGSR